MDHENIFRTAHFINYQLEEVVDALGTLNMPSLAALIRQARQQFGSNVKWQTVLQRIALNAITADDSDILRLVMLLGFSPYFMHTIDIARQLKRNTLVAIMETGIQRVDLTTSSDSDNDDQGAAAAAAPSPQPPKRRDNAPMHMDDETSSLELPASLLADDSESEQQRPQASPQPPIVDLDNAAAAAAQKEPSYIITTTAHNQIKVVSDDAAWIDGIEKALPRYACDRVEAAMLLLVPTPAVRAVLQSSLSRIHASRVLNIVTAPQDYPAVGSGVPPKIAHPEVRAPPLPKAAAAPPAVPTAGRKRKATPKHTTEQQPVVAAPAVSSATTAAASSVPIPSPMQVTPTPSPPAVPSPSPQEATAVATLVWQHVEPTNVNVNTVLTGARTVGMIPLNYRLPSDAEFAAMLEPDSDIAFTAQTSQIAMPNTNPWGAVVHGPLVTSAFIEKMVISGDNGGHLAHQGRSIRRSIAFVVRGAPEWYEDETEQAESWTIVDIVRAPDEPLAQALKRTVAHIREMSPTTRHILLKAPLGLAEPASAIAEAGFDALTVPASARGNFGAPFAWFALRL